MHFDIEGAFLKKSKIEQKLLKRFRVRSVWELNFQYYVQIEKVIKLYDMSFEPLSSLKRAQLEKEYEQEVEALNKIINTTQEFIIAIKKD
ncbi:MAG: hypothetical protein JWM09_295 [Francisellaceae bacterium]|nr:hypothetical protein [Francisellaceae bacterium]